MHTRPSFVILLIVLTNSAVYTLLHILLQDKISLNYSMGFSIVIIITLISCLISYYGFYSSKKRFEKTITDIVTEKNFRYNINTQEHKDLSAIATVFQTLLQEIKIRDEAIIAAFDEVEKRIKERTSELEKARSDAEKANQIKTEFLANMSHELRTPMHAILSYAEFGLDDINESGEKKLDDMKRYYERIYTSGTRLLALLNNLLDLSKLEAGKRIFNFKQHNPQMLIKSLETEIDNFIQEKGIQFLTKTEGNIQDITVDRDQIHQVLYNLSTNAIKFTPNNGIIEVSIIPTKVPGSLSQGILFSFSDSGIGVPDNEKETIFDKFIQSSKTTTGAGGTGLGLAICREIVEHHHGKLWCTDSELGGAKFMIAIPISQNEFLQ